MSGDVLKEESRTTRAIKCRINFKKTELIVSKRLNHTMRSLIVLEH